MVAGKRGEWVRAVAASHWVAEHPRTTAQPLLAQNSCPVDGGCASRMPGQLTSPFISKLAAGTFRAAGPENLVHDVTDALRIKGRVCHQSPKKDRTQ